MSSINTYSSCQRKLALRLALWISLFNFSLTLSPPLKNNISIFTKSWFFRSKLIYIGILTSLWSSRETIFIGNFNIRRTKFFSNGIKIIHAMKSSVCFTLNRKISWAESEKAKAIERKHIIVCIWREICMNQGFILLVSLFMDEKKTIGFAEGRNNDSNRNHIKIQYLHIHTSAYE